MKYSPETTGAIIKSLRKSRLMTQTELADSLCISLNHIMSSLAQEEARSISENTSWGRRKQFAEGKYSMPYSSFLGYDHKRVYRTSGRIVSSDKKIMLLFDFSDPENWLLKEKATAKENG